MGTGARTSPCTASDLYLFSLIPQQRVAEPGLLAQPWKLYATSPDPLPAVLLLSLWASTATLVLGVATDEYSWVDRCVRVQITCTGRHSQIMT